MNYPSTRKKAERSIKKAGMTMTLRRVTPGVFDPAIGAETGGTTADYPCVGVIGVPTMAGGNTWENGTLIQAGDIEATLGAETLPVEPKAGDVLLADGESYNVVSGFPVRPGGLALVYKALGRK